VVRVVLLTIAAASMAQARTETIRWTQAEPYVIAGFEIRWGTSPGSYPNIVDVGLPTPDGSGVYSADLALPDQTVYLVARSRDSQGFLSDFSSEKRLDLPGTSDPGDGSDVAWTQAFEGAPIGTSVSGWLDTDALNSLNENDSLFRVADLSGNRVMTTDSTQLNIHSHLPEGSSWSNYEFRGRMRVDDPEGSVGVTLYSAYPSADVYYKLFRIGTNDDSAFWIVGHPDIACDFRFTGIDPIAGVWYRFRFEARSSSTTNQIQARVWRDGDPEPPIWQATCLDESPDRPTSGTIGLWSRGTGSKYWDDLEVVAVPPLDESGTGSGEALGAPGQPVLITP
jgi:hypothetical protein